MNTKILIGLIVVSICGCSPLKESDDTCSVQPPETTTINRSAALEAAADLTAFAKAPISGNLKTEISNAFSATFQKVPDKVAACAMLNQTYVCIVDKERAREYLAFMRETQQCNR